MMSIQRMVFAIYAVAYTAIAASVVVTFKNLCTPLLVLFALSHTLVQAGYAATPIPVFTTNPFSIGRADCTGICLGAMSTNESRKTIMTKMVFLDRQDSPASTLANVLALMGSNPFWNALVVSSGMVSGVRLQCVAFSKSPIKSPFEHSKYSLRFNGVNQAKSGELLETLTCDDEGNQQPSQEYTPGRFRDYRRGTDLLITGPAPDAKAKI